MLTISWRDIQYFKDEGEDLEAKAKHPARWDLNCGLSGIKESNAGV